ncbi:MAG TPA: AarF/UbiB family protein, partial [Pirellulaceae bacterium]|nr:AarF/UbiB family protein [Pirellulaceae bacterium]
MKRTITAIPQLYRHLRRWTEIASILSKYGLADWLSRTNIEFIKRQFKAADGEILAKLTQPARIRLALTELGPAFIKLGQLLSTRADLVGKDLAEELTKLQSQTPADPFESVERIIEEELERPLAELFAEFEREPMASASIGQVHRARLPDGREVVVKIQHQGIEKKIETDLEIALGLAHLAQHLEDLRRYQPVAVVQELSRVTRRELDFQREFQHLLHFRRIFRRHKRLVVPEPIASHSSQRVLTMTRLDGMKFSELRNGVLDPEVRDQVARSGARLYLNMIFDEGYYHAD